MWTALDGAGTAWTLEYSFSKGAWATSLAFRGVDGIVVVSPPKTDDPAVMDALAAHGPVRALVANNAYHHLGQVGWRARFPQAVSYAPAGGLAALRKKHATIPWRAADELALPDNVAYADPPGFRTGEGFFSVRTGAGTAWFTGDLLSNIQRMPGPPFRWLFTWTGSAPGFRLFKPCVWFFVTDRKALRAWYEARLASDPPTVVVPAHGPAYRSSTLIADIDVQLRGL